MGFSQFPFCQYEKIGEWFLLFLVTAVVVMDGWRRVLALALADIKLLLDIERESQMKTASAPQQQKQQPHIQSSSIGFILSLFLYVCVRAPIDDGICMLDVYSGDGVCLLCANRVIQSGPILI